MIKIWQLCNARRIYFRLICVIPTLILACVTASAQQIGDGVYQVETINNDGQRYASTWTLRVNRNRIDGSSQWDCCPTRRTDPLTGRINGNRVTIRRQCNGQGMNERCSQVYEGRIRGSIIEGDFTHNGQFEGRWTMYLDNGGNVIGPAYNPNQPFRPYFDDGSYRVETIASDGQRYSSTWRLQISSNRIRGDSQWDCCPGRRVDRLNGRRDGDRVTIERRCSGQGTRGRCLEVYEGRIQGNVIEGTFTQNGRPEGQWTLYLSASAYDPGYSYEGDYRLNR